MSAINPVEWDVSSGLVPYPTAVRAMEDRGAAIACGTASERVWLLEHPALYTAGTSAKDRDLLDPKFPVFKSGRGGQYTYHGPGQRVGYVMLELNKRRRDVRLFVRDLEEWLIRSLKQFDVKGERRPGRVGIWVAMPDGSENKIAAIGVRLKRWVTFHGLSLNVDPDLAHYSGIVPCGIEGEGLGVTSLATLGVRASMSETDQALKKAFAEVFGPISEPANESSVALPMRSMG